MMLKRCSRKIRSKCILIVRIVIILTLRILFKQYFFKKSLKLFTRKKILVEKLKLISTVKNTYGNLGNFSPIQQLKIHCP